MTKVLSDLSSKPELLKNVIGLRPGGGEHDSIDNLRWVPASLRAVGPDCVGDHAHAWVFGQKPMAVRFASEDLPWNGSGGVLSGMHGCSLVLALPMAAVINKGSCVKDFIAFISNMAPAAASSFMADHAVWALLQAVF